MLRPRQGATTVATVDPNIGPILTHGAIENTNRILRAQGITLPDTTLVTPISTSAHKGALILATPVRAGIQLGALV
jgi:putative mRNA 3-end processing factor